jgi:hypothetical protein
MYVSFTESECARDSGTMFKQVIHKEHINVHHLKIYEVPKVKSNRTLLPGF